MKGRAATEFAIKYCKNCKKKFIIKVTKREMKRLFCSAHCAKSFNGKSNKGKKHSEEWKRNLSKQNFGENNPFYNRKHTNATKIKISITNKGNTYRLGKKQPQTSGNNNPAKRPEVRVLISKRVKETHWDSSGKNNPLYGVRKFGKDNPAYIHGMSKRPYPSIFSKDLKNKILIRDKFICQKCFNSIDIDPTVHHIDYNKFNNVETNLVSLCRSCNSRVNTKREYWKFHFSSIINNMEVCSV